MARTFIGELVLRLKDEMSGKAKTAAASLDTSVDRIQRAARQLNKTTWGGQFEERLRKLGASAGDIDKLRVAWDSLHTSMTSKNLGKAMQAMEKSNFKTAALGYFTEVATKADEADKAVGRFHSRWKEAAKDMATYGTIGAIMYGGANAIRGGFQAAAEYQREVFRQENANISTADQLRIAAEADRLTSLYPSAGLVNVMEFARSAQSMMGTVDRGLAILPDLVRSYVALQSTKGVDAAPEELLNLLRGIDNAGQNKEGQLGIDATRQIVAGLVRAAQVDPDVDPGKFFQFARRGKIAIPGLSTEFLANISPALMQDMKAETFGSALSSAYQAFVIGSSAVASKVNIARQKEIGIRNDDGLVSAELFGTNPYAWVKQVLVPALQKQGIDMNNETAVNQAIAQLSRNTHATGLLSRMVLQQAQIDRLLEQYSKAVGPEAADDALAKDPFVAWKGFVESWRELATAIRGMPEAVGILNSLTSGLQRFATALRNNDGGAQALLAGAGLGGLFGAYKITGMVYGLISAGTNLNAAATALEIAAAKLAGGNVNDTAATTKNAGWAATLAAWWKWGKGAAVGAAPGLLSEMMGATPGDTFEDQVRYQGQYRDALRRLLGLETSPLEDKAVEAGSLRQLMESVTTPYNANTPGLTGLFDRPVNEARQAGQDIQSALSVQATPTVNVAQLERAVALARELKSILSGVETAVSSAASKVANEMNRNFADHGVKP